MINIPSNQQDSYNEILNEIVNSLEITQTQYTNLTNSYQAVGKFLIDDPAFVPYHPVVSPQGSLRLGTIIQPVNEEDDLDIDLVYRLTKKHPDWTQYILKQKVGNRIKSSDRYKSMLDKEGRRNWTLKYRDNAESPKERYHMDILPCVADEQFEGRLQRMQASAYQQAEVDKISIRITDNKAPNYYTEKEANEWLKSNPDGYALWFGHRCKLNPKIQARSIQDIVPIGKQVEKTVLQRIVQLLKRHRDLMFKEEHDDKPISIIITTLAANAYAGEDNLFLGLYNVVERMDLTQKNGVYWVENPVNPEENFADKWPTHPKRQENFLRWLEKVKADMHRIINCKGPALQDLLSTMFGQKVSAEAFTRTTERLKTNQNMLKVGVAATLGSIGKSLNASNTFYGSKK